MQTVDCDTCNGRGWNPDERSLPGFETVDELIEYVAVKGHGKYGIRGIDGVENIGALTNCTYCNGFGVLSNRTHSKYKSQAMADRYRGTKAAMKCYMCLGKTKLRNCKVMAGCYQCDSTGSVYAFEFPADFNTELPADFNGTDRWHKPSYDSYVQNVRIVAKWSAQGVTWNEYNLGLGCVYSSTDYGKMWDLKENALVETTVRGKLLDDKGHQMCKFIKNNKFSDELWVVVKHNGYSVIVPDKPVSMAGIPPTYTPELLNKELF